MLKVEKVDAHYLDFQALWDISLTVKKEEIVALIGSNGSGKSSVLRAISGFLKPEKGTITIEDEQIQKMPPQDRVRLGISLVPEGRRLFPEMTVLENLEMGAYIKSARKAKEETLEWVTFNLPTQGQDRADSPYLERWRATDVGHCPGAYVPA